MDAEMTKPEVVEPTNGHAEPRGRKRLTETEIGAIKELRAQDKSYSEIAEATGISIGSIQKILADPAKTRKPRKAKAAPAPAAAKPVKNDTVEAVKAMLFDLIVTQGHPVAAVRGAIATHLGS